MFQKEWLGARKKLLRQIRAQIHMLSGDNVSALKIYSKNYHNEFRSRWSKSGLEEFHAELSRSRLVLGGDFHAFSQSQRLHLRILRELKRNVVLGLECIESKHQKHIDSYLKGEITEAEFLKRVKWQKNWGFPWENYKPLFDWALKSKNRVVGLNIGGVDKTLSHLKKRDSHAAQVIYEVMQENAGSLIYVIFGDLHLARPHLPQSLKDTFGYDPEPLILLQNADELYFKSVESELLKSAWYAAKGKRFCHISSPPWVKWQSYLMFLEHNFDRDWEDSDSELDLTDQMAVLVDLLARDFELQISIDKLAVYSASEFAVEGVLEEQTSPEDLKIAQRLIQGGRSFFIPDPGVIYLSRLSINHAAALAGQFIHSQLSHRKKIYWQKSSDFQKLVWIEAVGFFFSKLMNPHRKAENIKSLRARLEAMSGKGIAKEALLYALDQRVTELIFIHSGKFRTPRLKSRNPLVRIEASRILGEMIGEVLFNSFERGSLKSSHLIKWFKVDLESIDFRDIYYNFLHQLEESNHPQGVHEIERVEARW